jgi:hypothetical protein
LVKMEFNAGMRSMSNAYCIVMKFANVIRNIK